MDNVEQWRSMWEKEQTHNEYLSARISEMEAEIEDAKATAHERGYYQGKAAGDAFGAAMREHVTRLEAENKALREALKPFARIASEPAVKNARKSRKNYIHAVLLVAFFDAARAAIAETEGRGE